MSKAASATPLVQFTFPCGRLLVESLSEGQLPVVWSLGIFAFFKDFAEETAGPAIHRSKTHKNDHTLVHVTDTPDIHSFLFMQPEHVFALHQQLWYLSGVDATEWAESWYPAASCCLFLTEPPFETSPELSVGESCSAENIQLLTRHQSADVSTN